MRSCDTPYSANLVSLISLSMGRLPMLDMARFLLLANRLLGPAMLRVGGEEISRNNMAFRTSVHSLVLDPHCTIVFVASVTSCRIPSFSRVSFSALMI